MTEIMEFTEDHNLHIINPARIQRIEITENNIMYISTGKSCITVRDEDNKALVLRVFRDYLLKQAE